MQARAATHVAHPCLSESPPVPGDGDGNPTLIYSPLHPLETHRERRIHL
jgi:hypothetical protein